MQGALRYAEGLDILVDPRVVESIDVMPRKFAQPGVGVLPGRDSNISEYFAGSLEEGGCLVELLRSPERLYPHRGRSGVKGNADAFVRTTRHAVNNIA